MGKTETSDDTTKKPEAPKNADGQSPPAADGAGWQRQGRVLWKEWVKPLLIIGLVMFSFRSAVADWNDVPTGSMKPTILEGDRIFINKVAYDLKVPFTTIRLAMWDDPEWGDVVVLRSPEDKKRLVKRVVGLPGDTIEIRGNYLIRNDEAAEYSRLDPNFINQIDSAERRINTFAAEELEGRRHPIMSSLRAMGSPRGPFVVPDGHFFVMGDNRGNSRDSRYFGTVHRNEILGEATAVALSFDREDYWKPRWQRFFSKLP
ncbi:MAG: signal peptidase I [Acidobacteriota bacterium]